MKNKMKIMALAAASVFVFSCSKSSETPVVVIPPATTAYSIAAVLSTDSETRSKNTGMVTGTYDKTTKELIITSTHNLGDGITVGHLHSGDKTVNGPIILEFATPLASPTVQKLTLNAAQETSLQAGNLYVNLHSKSFPGGEIRGQLALAADGKLTATLNGANEVARSTKADGTKAGGTVTGTYDSATKALSITTTYSNLYAVPPATTPASPTMAHIHTGLAGVDGPVIFPFVAPITSPNTQTKTLTAAEETALLATGLYVNIHSVTYPLGEIRGQLLATKK